MCGSVANASDILAVGHRFKTSQDQYKCIKIIFRSDHI